MQKMPQKKTRERLTSLRLDFHVNRSVKQEEEEARKMTVGSGLLLLPLLESHFRDSYFLKMLGAYLLSSREWYSNKCALTWKVSATKSSRLLFQLSPSTRRTEGIGSGLLQTVEALNHEGYQVANGKQYPRLGKQITMLPTPDSNMGARGEMKEWKPTRPSGQHAQLTLNDAVKMLKTPSARDWKGVSPNKRRKESVEDQLNPTGQKTGLKLHSDFALYLMGYPLDWLDLE